MESQDLVTKTSSENAKKRWTDMPAYNFKHFKAVHKESAKPKKDSYVVQYDEFIEMKSEDSFHETFLGEFSGDQLTSENKLEELKRKGFPSTKSQSTESENNNSLNSYSYEDSLVSEDEISHSKGKSYYPLEISNNFKLNSIKEGVIKHILPSTISKHSLEFYRPPETDKIYPCPYCIFTANLRCKLREHLKSHEEHPYKCGECGNVCSNKGNLRRHMLIHTGERPFKCPNCDECFKTSTYMKIHNLKHTGERPYKCELCPATFTQGSHLKKHIGSHFLKRPFQCSFCEFCCDSPKEYKNHLLFHLKKEEFKCSFCDYTCKQSVQLQQHTLKHVEKTGFTCVFCKLTFKSSNELKKHDQEHCKGRNFLCPICNHDSKQSNRVKKHSRVHGGKSKSCCTCCWKPGDKETLERHMITDVGKTPYMV